MERGVSYIVIGLCFIASLIGFIIFIFWFSDYSLFDNDTITYKAYTTETLDDIKTEGLVKYKGMNIGRISNIRFSNDKFNEIEISVKINKKFPVRKNSYLVMEKSGILGDSYLSLVQNDKTEEVIKDKKDALLNMQSNAMTNLLGNMPSIMSKIGNIIDNANDIVNKDNVNNITSILSSLKTMTASMNVIVGVVEKNTNNIDSILNRVSSIAHNADLIVKTINKKVNSGEYDFKTTLAPTLNSLEESISDFNKVMENAQVVLEGMNTNPYNTIFGYRDEK